MRRSSLPVARVATVVVTAMAVCLTACGGFEVRSSRSDGVPPALLGEWEGEWISSGSRGTGAISVRVQQFDGDPVVSVELDNPCIVPQVYELLFVGEGIELRAGRGVVLQASLEGERKLKGIYTCAQDFGTWTADWSSDLPVIVDLSGEWIGDTSAAGGIGDDLLMHLTQSVDGGVVSLTGSLQFPAYMAFPMPVAGVARFRENDFDVVLGTPSGFLPALQLMGVGDVITLAIEDGVMVVSGGTTLPFASAVWTAIKTPTPR